MKVAFWSNSRGNSCVTSNLACISVLSTLRRPQERTIIFENHQNLINLGNACFSFYPDRAMVNEQTGYSVDTGMKRILKLVEKGEWVSEDNFFRHTKKYPGCQLFYLPSEGVKDADIFEYRMNRECRRTLDFLEHYGEQVFVDTSAEPLGSSRRILCEADIVVVNLSQSRPVLTHFFRNYSEIRKKAFYLIGNYESKSELTREFIMLKYGVSGKQIGTVPHNPEFADAASEGRLIPFLLQHLNCGTEDINYSFISAVREAERLFNEHLSRGKHEVWG